LQRRYQTGDQALVREMNLSTVSRYLQGSGPLSRAKLATLTGLNKTTISSLVEDLLTRGLVHEVGLDTSGGGRPARLLELAPQAGCIIGVALGVDFVSVILTDFVGRVLLHHRVETDPSAPQDAILAQTLQLIDATVAASQEQGTRLLGIGLATPGTVNPDEGVLVFSPNLQWHNVPFRQILVQHTGLPAFVDNDANAAAIAEHLFGVARQVQNFIAVFAGVGVGGGLFLNGKLYRGAYGFAGEIGHTSFMIESYRRPCRCGSRGCWETSVAQDSIIERMRARLAVGRNSIVSKLMAEQHSPLTLPLIIQAVNDGDTEAQEALIETGSLLGLGIASLISIFDPELIVLGGPLSMAGSYLVPPIKEAVENAVLPEIRGHVEITLSAFGADASVMGAAALVTEATLSNPGSVERLPVSAQLEASP
jgi:glucokinase-like ROK family protein